MDAGRMFHPVRWRLSVPSPAADSSTHPNSILFPVLPPHQKISFSLTLEAVAWVSIGSIQLYTSCCRIKSSLHVSNRLLLLCRKATAQPLSGSSSMGSSGHEAPACSQLQRDVLQCPHEQLLTPRPLETLRSNTDYHNLRRSPFMLLIPNLALMVHSHKNVSYLIFVFKHLSLCTVVISPQTR